jgi:phage-related protein
MASFPTDPLPVYPIEESMQKTEVLVTTFRDGTEQRRLKGQGPLRTFKLKFGGGMPVTNAERGFIVAHYTGQNGPLTSFSWTHPDRGEVITVRYVGPPTFTNVGYNFYNATVELQEVPV